MYRESLSLYRTRGKRCFGLTLSVILLVPIGLFSVGPALGQDGTTTENPAAQAELDQARSLRQNKQYPDAEQAFTDVINRYPQTDYALQAYQGLALTQMDQQLPAAIETVRKGLMQDFANYPEIAEAVYQVGYENIMKLWQGVKRGESAEQLAYYDGMVRQICRDVLQHWPDSEKAMWAQRGIVFADIYQSDFAAAQAGTETLLANYSEHKDLAQSVCWLGNDYRRMKQDDMARDCYQYVANHWPEHRYGQQSQFELILYDIERQEDTDIEAATDALLTNISDDEKNASAVQKMANECIARFFEIFKIKVQGESAKLLEDYDKLIRRTCGHILQQWPASEQAMEARRGIVFADIYKGDYAAAQSGTEMLIADYPDHKDLAQVLYWLGNDYLRMKQHAHARDCYQYVANQGPENPLAPSAQQQVILASIALNDDSAAQTAIDVLLRDYSEHKEIDKLISPIVQKYINKIFQGVKQGASFEDLETYDGLLRTLCEYILQNHPYSEHSIRAQRGIVFADIYKGDYDAAQAGTEILIAQYPDHKDLAQVLHWLGNDFRHMEQYTKARACYQYVADHWPQTDHGLWADGGIIRCNIRLNQDEQVLTAVEALMEKSPGNSDLSGAIFIFGDEYYKIAWRMVKQGETQAAQEYFIKTVNIWQNIVEELPESEYAPHAHYFMAICYKQLKQYSQAIANFQEVANRWPQKFTWRTYFQIGSAYESMKRAGDITVSEADNQLELVYSTLIYVYPESPVTGYTSYKLGKLYYEKSQWDKAIEYYEMFRNTSPSSPLLPYVLYHLGESYEKTGQYNSARSVYEIFLEKADPSSRYIQKVKVKLQNM